MAAVPKQIFAQEATEKPRLLLKLKYFNVNNIMLYHKFNNNSVSFITRNKQASALCRTHQTTQTLIELDLKIQQTVAAALARRVR